LRKEAYVRSRKLTVLVVSGALLVASTGVAVAQVVGANAELKDTEGNDVGTAEFAEGPGGVATTVDLQPGQKAVGPGEHAVHIHEKGDCSSSDFKSAGEHFNPQGKEHGFENPKGPHAGDLPDIKVNEDGSATAQAKTDRVTLSKGETSLFDSDGSALVIHAKADDFKTDPSGESGDRQVCGKIQKTSQQLPTSGGINIIPLAALLGVAGLCAGILLWRRVFHSQY
jgi:Cu-Zn family superoxide dismutase